MSRTIFLTGPTGNLGAPLLWRLLQRAEVDRVYTLVRAKSDQEGLARIVKAVSAATGDVNLPLIHQKLRPVCGDITDSRLGLAPSIRKALLSEVTDIIHSAAQTAFTLPLKAARHTNGLGAEHIAALVRDINNCGKLRRYFHISTAFVCGRSEGTIDEHYQDATDFSNSYEQSKFEAEQVLRQKYSDLPCTIIRPTIVAGDSETGKILACNVLYTPLKWILHGYLDRRTVQTDILLDVVPVDYVADATVALLFHSNQILPSPIHLAAGEKSNITVNEIVEFTLQYAHRREYKLHALNYRNIDCRTTPYYPYVTLPRFFVTGNSELLLAPLGLRPRPLADYLGCLLDHAFQTNWSKNLRGDSCTQRKEKACAA